MSLSCSSWSSLTHTRGPWSWASRLPFTDQQTDRQPGRQAGRERYTQSRQAGGQADRHRGSQKERERATKRQGGRHAYKPCVSCPFEPADRNHFAPRWARLATDTRGDQPLSFCLAYCLSLTLSFCLSLSCSLSYTHTHNPGQNSLFKLCTHTHTHTHKHSLA